MNQRERRDFAAGVVVMASLAVGVYWVVVESHWLPLGVVLVLGLSTRLVPAPWRQAVQTILHLPPH